MAALTLRNINKTYPSDFTAIPQLDLDIQDGEFVVFVGPSGCGKSTLLRMIAGLEEISGGDLMFDGEKVNDLAPGKRGISMVFQNYALYPHMTVYDNMAFGLRNLKVDEAEIEKRIRYATKQLKMEHLLERRPREMSGGQQQRVAIGRSIVRKPRVFLFDEPLSNLDAALRQEMRTEIALLHSKLDATMIYVTHDQVEAMTMADRIVVLKDGLIEQVGTPMEIYEKPATKFVAEFIGAPKMNIFSCHLIEEQNEQKLLFDADTKVSLGNRRIAGHQVYVGIRPKQISFAEDGNLGRARVEVIERLGDETNYLVRTNAGETVLVKSSVYNGESVGDEVTLNFDIKDTHLFDMDGKRLEEVDYEH